MASERKPARLRAVPKKSTPADEWRMYWLIFNTALESDVIDLLQGLGIKAYSRWDEVKGSGNSGPHLNDEIWPAVNALYIFAAPAALTSSLSGRVENLRKQFPGEGVKLIVQPCLGIY